MKNWRNTREYRIWRTSAIRQQKCCAVCGTMKHREVHHLNDASNFPDERYDTNNAIVLCAKHHDMFHYKFKKNSRVKTTKKEYINFITIIKEGMKLERISNV